MSEELKTPETPGEAQGQQLAPLGETPPAAGLEVADAAGQPDAEASVTVMPPTGRFRLQFGLMYGVLGLGLAAGIAALAVSFVAPRLSLSPAWASWRPPSGSTTKVENEIASYVGGQYRLSNGGPPLVAVIAKPPVVTNGTSQILVSVIAIKSSSAAASANNGYLIYPTNQMWTDDLCGLGSECSIDQGTPTQQRERDVRREALELALYTFKYTSLTSLVTYLPPPAGSPPGELLFFQKSTYAKELNQPLDKTLTLVKPPLPTQADTSETKTINNLTLPEVYSYQPALLQDGSAALVLSPLGASS